MASSCRAPTPTSTRSPPRALPPEVGAAIDYAAANIRSFHTAQLPEAMWLKEIRPGAFAGDRYRPIPSVACYVPRGKGAFPSVTMMTTIPAVVAGVPRIVVITPPGPDGQIDAATLVAAELAGVREVYKCGGAQGIAAVAYGTESVPRRRQGRRPRQPLRGRGQAPACRSHRHRPPAGPGEAIVLADETADGRIAALDLVIESEHGPDSSVYPRHRLARSPAAAALPAIWAALGAERRAFSQAVLRGPRGGIVLAPDMAEALAFVNDYAPEHLEMIAPNRMRREPSGICSTVRSVASTVRIKAPTIVPA